MVSGAQARREALGFGQGVYTDKSVYGGNGLFASVFIPKGNAITWYQGRKISHATARFLEDRLRHWHIITVALGHDYIDGFKADEMEIGMGAASLANDAAESGGENNARDYRVFDHATATTRIYLVATKDISPHDEITWRYMHCPNQGPLLAELERRKKLQEQIDPQRPGEQSLPECTPKRRRIVVEDIEE